MPEAHNQMRGVEPYQLLAAVVLQRANSDPEYFLTPCGRFWCDIIGLDHEACFDKAKKLSGLRLDYKPRTTCPDCGRKGII